MNPPDLASLGHPPKTWEGEIDNDLNEIGRNR